ncbi:MAG: TonB-dependent receptor plug domain-containing protein [Parcubacteria group bacterium]
MSRSRNTFARLMCGAAVLALTSIAGAANAAEYDIAPQPLAMALKEFGMKTGQPVLYGPSLADAKMSAPVVHAPDAESALVAMLDGTGLTYRRNGDTFLIVSASDPQSGSAAGDGADAGTVAALVVTAQKREENIQDVPIAISAFTEKSLQEQKIEGGFDLLKAIPNVSFSKNNFSGYNFSIRGIGTKAISVTTDPGVAVEFNSTPLIRNRLFEQEYFDVERVEVLRGPQGTLHGRNATAGVINVISAKPVMNEFNGWLKDEVGNYNTKRLSAMVNVPLVNDKLAVRFAGAATMRDGFTKNLFDNTRDDGRNLWSARMTIGFNPTENIRSNFIWERFEEDDDRSRTSKQLCTRDSGPTKVGDRVITAVPGLEQIYPVELQRGIYSQGCLPGSLYDDAAYGAPNGWSIPFIAALAQQFTGIIGFDSRYSTGTYGALMSALKYGVDPYGGVEQSHDLRAIYSRIHPTYHAKTDVVEWNVNFNIARNLDLALQTGYAKDQIGSTQDYNRYTTVPAFNDSTYAVVWGQPGPDGQTYDPSPFRELLRGGVFCDPQVGCSDTIVGEDLSRARSEQFSQEVRISSSFEGPVNFVLGANFLRYRTVEDYYVFNNGITLAGIVGLTGGPFGAGLRPVPDRYTTNPDCTTVTPLSGLLCVPIEQNPISDIQNVGHNYFLSRNPYVLTSKSAFGELYWNASESVKITAGLRYTDDKKRFTRIPSQTLLTPRDYLGITQLPNGFFRDYILSLPFTGSGFGYPIDAIDSRMWREVTGRLGAEWRPTFGYTDQTLIYAFYARGYKGGGFNPPRPGFNYEAAAATGNVYAFAAPAEFDPEFVNSFEVGAKNTFLGGAATLNATAFFYDYAGYQISKIVDRSAYNENFDARVWGLEFEAMFAPTRNLRLNGSLGYLDTALGDGSKSIDVMNRTAGHTDWMIVKPAVTIPSNCIIPVHVAEVAGTSGYEITSTYGCPGGGILGGNLTGKPPFYLTLPDGTTYDPAEHPEANYGAGFDTDVSGHELPNSPHFTVTLGAQYSFDFLENWRGTIRADGYWQSQSWARVYELPIDKLHGWYNANLSVWVERPDDGLKIEFYVKNLLDETPITDAFINSDDTALTTNVFTLDPRLIGLSIRKEF